jgi:hypothetical protein
LQATVSKRKKEGSKPEALAKAFPLTYQPESVAVNGAREKNCSVD